MIRICDNNTGIVEYRRIVLLDNLKYVENYYSGGVAKLSREVVR